MFNNSADINKKHFSVNDIAKVCYEACRAVMTASGDTNYSPWEQATESQIQATIDGIRYVQNHPDTTAEIVHDNWMKFKAKQNWVYGSEKNEKLKTHPCLVPFDQLPLVEKIKDQLIINITQALS